MPKIQPFERHTAQYDKWFELNEMAYKSELAAVRSLIPRSSKGLEIGSGSGRFAGPLGIRTGVEPSKKMRLAGQARNVESVPGVAEDLPFPDHSFDFALMVTTVCFLDDIIKAFRETRRILKPAGSFITGLIDKNSPIGQTYQKIKDKNPFYSKAVFYSTEEIIGYLRQAGFIKPQIRQTLYDFPDKLKHPQRTRKGYGKGSFVVIRVKKS